MATCDICNTRISVKSVSMSERTPKSALSCTSNVPKDTNGISLSPN